MRQMVTRSSKGLVVASAFLLAAALCFVACNSGSPTAIDLTVQSDAELHLESIEIIARAAGKPDFHRTVKATASAKITIEISGLADRAPVTLEAQGIRSGETVILARARVAVSVGKHVTALIHLEAACANQPACPGEQTCAGGACVAIGGPVDAGTMEAGSKSDSANDVSSTGGAGTGGSGAGVGGGPGGDGAGGSTGGASGTGGRGGNGSGGSGSGGNGSGGNATGGNRTGGNGTGGNGTGGAAGSGGSGSGGAATGGRGTGGAATGGAATGGAPGKNQGTTCTGNSECTSLHCIEGVCCDTDCTGKCMSCRMTNTNMAEGKCAFVKAGAAHGSDCAASSAMTCGLDGMCDGSGACRRYSSGTICGQQSCPTGTSSYTAASTCNGTGTCVAGSAASCINYLCSAAAGTCRTNCGTTADCVPTAYCFGTTCTPKKAAGQICAKAEECTSGSCGGRCCASAAECMCAQPTARNLFRNPGFDTDISGGWDIGPGEGTISWSDQDATTCAYSGSARIVSSGGSGTTSKKLGQCVAVSASTAYTFGVRIKGGGGFATCTIDLYPMPSCAGSAASTIDPGTLWLNAAWSGDLTQDVQTASNTASVYVRCFFPDSGESSFDMFYLAPTPGQY